MRNRVYAVVAESRSSFLAAARTFLSAGLALRCARPVWNIIIRMREPDIRERLYAITGGGTVPVEKLSPEQQGALKKLQALNVISFDLQEEVFEPVEEQIEKEMFALEVK